MQQQRRDQTLQILLDMIQMVKRRNLGVLHPSFNLSKCIKDRLHKHLPANIHQIVSGKMCVSLTRVPDGENVLVSDFQSKDEVVDALLCSCFIPFFCGFFPPSFRGVRYVDGGLSDNMPYIDSKTTITVCPFYGEHDICPKVKSTNFLHMNFGHLSLRICSGNTFLLSRTFLPPDIKVHAEISFRGYLDALRFLEERGICNKLQPCLNLSSEEVESEFAVPSWEEKSPESSPGPVAAELGPEKEELLEHLRLSILPWDDSILETLSPKLTTVMTGAMKHRDGYVSKICSFLPIRILSYVMLPCTLPVESAIAFIQRLVMWFPDIPKDIQWLQGVTPQLCAQMMMYLFPASRPRVSASCRQASPPRLEHSWTPYSPGDPDTHPVDCPVGAKAQATQQSIFKSSPTYFLGNKVSAGAEACSVDPTFPIEKSH
ncbi:PREDICTED: patatin-like phospholipase domain-containing protein 3 [Galeopterus variegatus]|uniref:Patatin-like phospholipase domain-containing protein 3 n=1 Tax=Galeopterus variegatus TaxID=482537 RepID=A0ABM0RGM4_GALVR|nr:PREDICTED: patatin-like phospholipase domain-containing protein 3 [Galeopterus variegatus]